MAANPKSEVPGVLPFVVPELQEVKKPARKRRATRKRGIVDPKSKPKRPLGVKKKAALRKRKQAETVVDKRLEKLRGELVERITQVSGVNTSTRVVLNLQSLIHLLSVIFPILFFWHAADEELKKSKKRKTKSRKAKKKVSVSAPQMRIIGSAELRKKKTLKLKSAKRTSTKVAVGSESKPQE